MAIYDLLLGLGEEIEDPGEETFLLFSQSLPSQNLGFVDAKATSLEITVSGRDLNVTQSPGLLSSNRDGGTTGAVVWKIAPLFAEWITSKDNILFETSVLDRTSQVLELGCGISGIVAIMLAPKIGRYLATDQDYVFKLLKQNVKDNALEQKASAKAKGYGKAPIGNESGAMAGTNIEVIALDWETNSVSNLMRLTEIVSSHNPQPIDAVVACDCIYNEALIEPFVRTCVEICHLVNELTNEKPTICVIAQQLRSDSIFGAWLSAFHKAFRVWKVPDEALIEDLNQGSGFVVHVGILRGDHS